MINDDICTELSISIHTLLILELVIIAIEFESHQNK